MNSQEKVGYIILSATLLCAAGWGIWNMTRPVPQFQDIVASDHFCGLYQNEDSFKKIGLEEKIHLFKSGSGFKKAEKDPDNAEFEIMFNALTRKDAIQAEKILQASNSFSATLIRTLIQAHLMSGYHYSSSKPSREDLLAASKQLEAMKKTYPDDASLNFFKFGVLWRMRHFESESKDDLVDQLRNELNGVAWKKTFQNPVLGFTRALWRRGLGSGRSFYLMNQIRGSIALPDYVTPYAALKALADKKLLTDRAVKDGLKHLGQLMMQKGASDQPGHEFVSWMALEYQVGHKLAETAMAPEPVHEPDYVSLVERTEAAERKANPVIFQYFDAFEHDNHRITDCGDFEARMNSYLKWLRGQPEAKSI